ncbi:PHP domain-containing protein, partial [Streptomyces sp. NPDC127110]|uniref:PHP domain-containing protein n=1 Tax=Streptomyces sp. NPDC127110 TaxID=3345362 RepID=UPI00362E3B1D
MPGFTHLHTVSGFSVRYGASHPERLAERAAERGMDALALTDRDSLAGAVRFAKAAAAAGIRPLFGVDLAVSPAVSPAGSPGGRAGSGPAGSGPAGEASYRRRTPVRGGAFVDESAPRALFLARDGAAGWAELCRLVTTAFALAGRGEGAGAGASGGFVPGGGGGGDGLAGPGGFGADGLLVPGGSADGFTEAGGGFGGGGLVVPGGFDAVGRSAGPGSAAAGHGLPWGALRGEGVFVLLGPGSEVGRGGGPGPPPPPPPRAAPPGGPGRAPPPPRGPPPPP